MAADGFGGLHGLRVVEMGVLLAGPFCGQLLADHGAEVIKIEQPGTGDPMREWGREKPHGKSLWWPVVARNKKSVTLDLRSDDGQELARQLIDQADVLVENFRPGTLERWNLSPERLHQTNPGLVIVRVTGFGQTGRIPPNPATARSARPWVGCATSSAIPTGRPPVPASPSVIRWPQPTAASAPWSPCRRASTRAEGRSWTPPSTRQCSG
jgi:formyl-CoA transferase